MDFLAVSFRAYVSHFVTPKNSFAIKLNYTLYSRKSVNNVCNRYFKLIWDYWHLRLSPMSIGSGEFWRLSQRSLKCILTPIRQLVQRWQNASLVLSGFFFWKWLLEWLLLDFSGYLNHFFFHYFFFVNETIY